MNIARFALGACAIGLLFAAAPASASTINVMTTADAVVANATCSLREAITSANMNNGGGSGCVSGQAGPSTDTIALDALTYSLTIGGEGEDANATGDLDPDTAGGPVTIQGVGAPQTVVDAQSVDRAFDFKNNGALAVLDGLRIANGETTGSSGGAIRTASLLNITDAEIRDSEVTGVGGGLSGGAVSVQAGSLSVARTEIVNNSVIHDPPPANAGYSIFGGGIGYTGVASNSTIVDSQIDNNHVVSLDSAMFLETFPAGGGIGHQAAGTLTILNSTIARNDLTSPLNAEGGGLAFLHNGNPANLRIDNSTFALNDSGIATSPIAIGGGISAIGGTTKVSHSSFADNAATAGRGDAISFDDGAAAAPVPSFEIRNSVIDEGGTEECHAPANGEPLTSLGGNVERDAGAPSDCAFGQASDALQGADALFPLAPNGGLTDTLALTAGSLAIDRVPPASCVNFAGVAVPLDQRGFDRVGDCDSGSYEFG